MNINPKRRQRMAIERHIVLSLAAAAINEGYSVTINNGGDEDELSASRSLPAIDEAIMLTDEDQLSVVHPNGKRATWFYLVYGNGGYDVICDYGANDLGEKLYSKVAPLIDKYEAM